MRLGVQIFAPSQCAVWGGGLLWVDEKKGWWVSRRGGCSWDSWDLLCRDNGRAGRFGGRTCHLQALQLPQAQEGTGLHGADDIIPQVPVGGKWGGPHTSSTLPDSHLPLLPWSLVASLSFLLNPVTP